MKTKEYGKFYPQALQHVYHRCADKGVLFYCDEDRIVYYTLAAVHSKKANVKVAAVSLMFTHLHQSVKALSRKDLTRYLRNTDSAYTRLYNNRYKRNSCQLFDRPVGISQKYQSKEKRSNIIYVYNNHVEKGLCKESVQERWSFLAYAFSDHPFSKPINRDKISKPLLKALRLVDRRVIKCKNLEYYDLNRIFPALDEEEIEQFIDYVISKYALIDFQMAISLFGSPTHMVMAINSTTGSENDINEEYCKQQDTKYVELIRFARQHGFLERIHSMSESEKMNWIIDARNELWVPYNQLRKFFHYDFMVTR